MKIKNTQKIIIKQCESEDEDELDVKKYNVGNYS